MRLDPLEAGCGRVEIDQDKVRGNGQDDYGSLRLKARSLSLVLWSIDHWKGMLLGKMVTVLAGFGAETTSRDSGRVTERDMHPNSGR